MLFKKQTARRLAGRFFFTFVLLCGTLVCPRLWADPSDALTELSQHPTWLRLLKADKQRDRTSAIHTPEFFVAGSPDSTAFDELAQLVELMESASDDTVMETRCQFPARLYWLSFQLEKPIWRDFSHCTRLNQWAAFDELSGISLILISGYYGNPASTFGHSLLRLNNGVNTRDSSLLDLSVNFGAQVPPQEPAIVYVIRGLFGGYFAGFSDSTFFAHDQTYSRIEFRDRWEYDLALTPYQERLLVYHLWEITGKKFTYYFLEENCSYRLAELLELVLEDDFMQTVSTWYAPVSLFHDLHRLDEGREPGLIERITYVPSSEATLRYSLAALPPSDRARVFEMIDVSKPLGPPTDAAENFEGEPQRLSTAIDYLNYSLAPLEETEAPEIRERRREIIGRRLRLPPGSPVRSEPPLRQSPALFSPPSAFDAGVGYSEVVGEYLQLGTAAFRKREIGNNSLEQSSLIVADLTFGVSSDRIFLDRLVAVEARKLNAPVFRLPEESATSWRVSTGLERARSTCSSCLEAYGEAFWGWASALDNNWKLIWGGFGRLSSRDAAVEIGPEASLSFAPHWRLAGEVTAGWVYAADRDRSRERVTLKLRFSISRTDELSLLAEKDFGNTVSMAYSHRW